MMRCMMRCSWKLCSKSATRIRQVYRCALDGVLLKKSTAASVVAAEGESMSGMDAALDVHKCTA